MPLLLTIFLILTVRIGASARAEGIVAVAVPPYCTIVQRLAGDRLQAISIAPEGADPHTFLPTVAQCSQLSQADVWLITGEPFEGKCLAALGRKEAVEILDLRATTALLPAPGPCQHAHHRESKREAMDTHLWLSPKRLAEQSAAIAGVLAKRFPGLGASIFENLKALVRDLDELREDLERRLAQIPCRTLLVSHPALTYFCADFRLEQLSAEFDGREPTSQQQTALLRKIRAQRIDRIFLLKPHSERASRRLAQMLNLQIAVLEPYGLDPLKTLRALGAQIAQLSLSGQLS